MDIFPSKNLKMEGAVLFFLLVLLGGNALLNAGYGFFLPAFAVTVVPAVILSFFFPRAGLVASLLLTIFFERFFTLQPLIFGESVYKLYPLDAILVAVFLSVALIFLKEGKRFYSFRWSDWLLFLFFLFTSVEFVAGLFHGSAETSLSTAFSTWKNYVFYGALAFTVASFIRTKEDLADFVKLFLMGVAASAVFLCIGIIRGGGLWTEYTPLSTPGTRFLAFPHAFYFSLAFVTLVLSIPFWFKKSRTRDILFSVFVLVLAVGVLGSLMRHLWLGLGVTFLLATLVSPVLFGRQAVSFFSRFFFPAAFLLSAVIFLLAAFPSSGPTRSASYGVGVISERLSSIGNEYDESFAWRERVWESAMHAFSEKPLLGIGFGAKVPVEMGDEYRQYVEIRNMHNSWLAMLIQTGVVGMSLFGAFLAVLFLPFSRIRITDEYLRSARFVLFGLVAFQGAVFFSQPYLETNLLGIFFWVTLGVARATAGVAADAERN